MSQNWYTEGIAVSWTCSVKWREEEFRKFWSEKLRKRTLIRLRCSGSYNVCLFSTKFILVIVCLVCPTIDVSGELLLLALWTHIALLSACYVTKLIKFSIISLKLLGFSNETVQYLPEEIQYPLVFFFRLPSFYQSVVFPHLIRYFLQGNVSVRMVWISSGALRCRNKKKNLDDSSRLDVVEIARVPDFLPSLFPSWSG